MSRAIDGTMYMPGIVGLNNIKANDYCNVILQVNQKNSDSFERVVQLGSSAPRDTEVVSIIYLRTDYIKNFDNPSCNGAPADLSVRLRV